MNESPNCNYCVTRAADSGAGDCRSLAVLVGYIGFSSALVDRIRLWTDNDDGCGGWVGNAKNLTIQYTADLVALSSRTWLNVTGLANGFQGLELLNSSAVNSGGTVAGDVHFSAGGRRMGIADV